MKVVYSELQKKHDPKSFLATRAKQPKTEVPERAGRLLAAAKKSGLQHEQPDDHGIEPIAAVHSERYIQYLQNIYTRWSRIDGGSPEVIPGIHPDRRDGAYPASAVGHAGWHHVDTAAPIAEHTWESAYWSAQTTIHAAQEILSGAAACYALARPPGHHAAYEYAAGFCYLSNSAIAAQYLSSQHQRVAVLDVDVHHGNGTQDIFYRRADVLTVSVHADPVRFYPFFWGHATENGAGNGEGFNQNFPLPRGTGDDEYCTVLDRAIDSIKAFNAGALVVALGLDAFEGDPLRGLAITTRGFGRIGERIAAIGLPTVLVQEGGYLSNELGSNLSTCMDGFCGNHRL
jgi:acetoin utilization deacetylase AcuC-like enzyme